MVPPIALDNRQSAETGASRPGLAIQQARMVRLATASTIRFIGWVFPGFKDRHDHAQPVGPTCEGSPARPPPGSAVLRQEHRIRPFRYPLVRPPADGARALPRPYRDELADLGLDGLSHRRQAGDGALAPPR